MDKYISFIIIVIIIYKTYEYCSPHKEGFSMPDFSVNSPNLRAPVSNVKSTKSF